MINIVIPMAGRGSRFSGFKNNIPKPFADVKGKPMFVRVIENFIYPDARFILIARKEHIETEEKLVKMVEKNYNAKFIAIENITEGTVCTALFAREEINNDTPLLITMADQIIDFDFEDFIHRCSDKNSVGNIVCFYTDELAKRYSYAKLNDSGNVALVKEKKIISNLATAGLYYFTKGKYFVNSAIDMIINNDRANNEFYVAPVYNYLISKNKEVEVYLINKNQIHDLGTKDKLEIFLKHFDKFND